MAFEVGAFGENLGDLVAMEVVQLGALGRNQRVIEGDAGIVAVVLLLPEEVFGELDEVDGLAVELPRVAPVADDLIEGG